MSAGSAPRDDGGWDQILTCPLKAREAYVHLFLQLAVRAKKAAPERQIDVPCLRAYVLCAC
jgi:hypothetical protein